MLVDSIFMFGQRVVVDGFEIADGFEARWWTCKVKCNPTRFHLTLRMVGVGNS